MAQPEGLPGRSLMGDEPTLRAFSMLCPAGLRGRFRRGGVQQCRHAGAHFAGQLINPSVDHQRQPALHRSPSTEETFSGRCRS